MNCGNAYPIIVPATPPLGDDAQALVRHYVDSTAEKISPLKDHEADESSHHFKPSESTHFHGQGRQAHAIQEKQAYSTNQLLAETFQLNTDYEPQRLYLRTTSSLPRPFRHHSHTSC